MSKLYRLYLDEETDQRLREVAEAERRPAAMQAEVLIRRGLKLPIGRTVGAGRARERQEVAHAS